MGASTTDDATKHRTSPKPKRHALTKAQQALYVAMDCEMVGVGHRCKSHIARVTMINWEQDIVYDRLVRPSEPVTDYRTFVSGITAADLESAAAVDLATCRAQVQELLRGKILVGHALKNDLLALGIQHPWQSTRDTGKFEPFMKVRFDDGVLWPRKLKELTAEKLQKEIRKTSR